MKRLLCIVLFVIPSISIAASAPAPEQIDRYLNKLTQLGQFNGVVLLTEGDQVLLKQAYNYESFPTWSRVTVDDAFHIASVRKLFNQYLVYQAAPASLASRPLTDWVKMNNLAPEWTLDMLLNHRSGLPRGERFDFGDKVYNEAAVRQLIEQQELLFEPGTQQHYSNYGYLLADLALADYYQLPMSALMQQRLMAPLALKHTYSAQQLPTNADIARGMYVPDDTPQAVDFSLFTQFPSGDIFSTVDDLRRFVRQLNHPSMFEQSVVEHAGAKRGYRSYVYFDKTSDTVLVLLSNYSEMPIAQVIKDMKAIINGEAVTMPHKIERKAIAFQPDTAMRITGKYRLEVNGQLLSVVCQQQQLYLIDHSTESQEKTLLQFETPRILFFDSSSSDSLLIKGSDEDPQLAITGMGNMEFPMTQLEQGSGCQHE